MERKAMIINGQSLKQLNEMLSEGWEVEHISAFAQGMTTGRDGQSYGVITGPYGAYVILKRKKQKLTENEMLPTKGIMEWNRNYISNKRNNEIMEDNIWE